MVPNRKTIVAGGIVYNDDNDGDNLETSITNKG